MQKRKSMLSVEQPASRPRLTTAVFEAFGIRHFQMPVDTRAPFMPEAAAGGKSWVPGGGLPRRDAGGELLMTDQRSEAEGPQDGRLLLRGLGDRVVALSRSFGS